MQPPSIPSDTLPIWYKTLTTLCPTQKVTSAIENIPPGTYDVIAWHPYIAEAKDRYNHHSRKRETPSLDFDFNGNDEKRKLYHDDIKGYRFNTWYDSNEKFYGGERVDDPVEELQAFCDEDHLCNNP